MIAFHCRFEILGEEHDRAGFHCGEEALDRYFQTQATQDMRRRVANCFIAFEIVTGKVGAFYTMSAASIPLLTCHRKTPGVCRDSPPCPRFGSAVWRRMSGKRLVSSGGRST